MLLSLPKNMNSPTPSTEQRKEIELPDDPNISTETFSKPSSDNSQEQILDAPKPRPVELPMKNEEKKVSILKKLYEKYNSIHGFAFIFLLGSIQLVLMILFGVFTYIDDSGQNPEGLGLTAYSFYFSICVIIFIGFSLARAAFKKYSLNSIGYTFLVSCLAIQFHIFFNGFWNQVSLGFPSPSYLTMNNSTNLLQFQKPFPQIMLNLKVFNYALVSTASTLVAFGAVIGKISASQLLIFTLIESFAYNFNIFICITLLQASNINGSMLVHGFGGFYGICCAWISTKHEAKGDIANGKKHPNLIGSRTNHIFSFLGLLFLWVFRPAFNAALVVPVAQNKVLINTILATISSCTFSFCISKLLHDKFSIVEIVNATYAGGLAIACDASLAAPIFPLIIGAISGILGSIGLTYFTPFLLKYLKLHDTCGIFNIHVLPGLIGGISSVIYTSIYATRSPLIYVHGNLQFLYQIALIVISASIAIVSGLFCGLLIRWFFPTTNFYDDSQDWDSDAGEGEEKLV